MTFEFPKSIENIGPLRFDIHDEVQLLRISYELTRDLNGAPTASGRRYRGDTPLKSDNAKSRFIWLCCYVRNIRKLMRPSVHPIGCLLINTSSLLGVRVGPKSPFCERSQYFVGTPCENRSKKRETHVCCVIEQVSWSLEGMCISSHKFVR